MTDLVIAVVSCILLLLAFTYEGISHGLRSKETHDPDVTGPEARVLNKKWHMYNTVYLITLLLGIYYATLGSDYTWKGHFDMFFVYDLGWLALHVILARFIVFDYAYNVSRGHGMGYIGKTSFMDKIINSYIGPLFLFLFKLTALLLYVLSMLGVINLI